MDPGPGPRCGPGVATFHGGSRMSAGGVAAIVVAAGRGVRAGGGVPKQYREVRGAPVIRHALSLFTSHPQVTLVQPVIHRDDAATFAEASAGLDLRAAA